MSFRNKNKALFKNKKDQKAWSELINSDEPLSPEQTLPVHELPQVRRQQRAEFKKRAPLIRRVGESAMYGFMQSQQGFWGFIAGGSKDNPEALQKAAKEYKRTKTGNYAAYMAVGATTEIEQRRAKHWEAARDKAVADFRASHPNIANREAELRAKWEKQEQERQREQAISNANEKTRFAIQYFEKRSGYSFAKAIPRRPQHGHEGFSGDYDELAKTTIQEAMEHSRHNGVVTLLGTGLEAERVSTQEAAGKSYADIAKHETEYVGGTATALWKLGFVEFEDEQMVSYGGKFNPNTEWNSSYDVTSARLPFDPNNELHQMLMPTDRTLENPCLEAWTTHDPEGGHSLHLQVREIPAASRLPLAVAA